MSTKSGFVFTICLISSLLVRAVQAETLTVTSNADSGDGTLRALVGSAADGDVIAIPDGMAITLSSAIALPNASISIIGQGSRATVSGNRTTTIFSYNGSGRQVERRFEFKNLKLSEGRGASSGVLFVERLNNGYELDVVCTDCTFTGNRSLGTKGEGAVFAHAHGNAGTDFSTVPFSLYCTNCTFAANAGGSAIAGASGNYTVFGREVRFVDCDFMENALAGMSEEEIAAGEIPTGYGLFNLPASDIVFDGCSFMTNKSSSSATIYRNDLNANNGMHLHIIDTDFIDNETTGGKGALITIFTGEAEISGCRFLRNKSDYNGIGIIGKDGCTLKLDIQDSLFEDNVVTSGEAFDKGGLFFARQGADSRTSILRCSFRRNVSTSASAVYRNYNGNGGYSISDCVFENNQSLHGSVLALTSSGISVSRCSFVYNGRYDGATGDASSGMFPFGAGSSFSNCTFYGNTMSLRSIIDVSRCAVYGCTIVSNTMSAVSTYSPISSLTLDSVIINSVIVGNKGCDMGPSVAGTYSGCRCVAAGTGKHPDVKLDGLVSDENIVGKGVEELGLVLPPAANGSKIKLLDGTSPLTIAITETSPLRKAGKVFADYPLLFDGRGIRRDASAPCIGAYEYVPAPAAAGMIMFLR